MTTPLRFCLVLTCLFLISGLQAQPEQHQKRYGCHMTEAPIVLPKLTEAEKVVLCSSNARSDSIDILNYSIDLDLRQWGNAIDASCTVTFTPKEEGIDFLPLDLLKLNIDSITWAGGLLSYNYDELLLDIQLPQTANIGDTMDVTIYYNGLPTPDQGGLNGRPPWGGFKWDSDIGYNLGIGLSSNPYNIGRSWHPCFDNFVERATYDISITTNNGKVGYAVGEFLGEDDLGNGAIKRNYRLDIQNPTYLTGVAAANYIEVHDMYSGQYGDYPILLVGRPGDATDMVESFGRLDEAIATMEDWFGPYQWEQVGYVMTPQGAMEHSSLIAFPYSVLGGGQDDDGMNGLMAHELAHHWWGNVTTLSCPENMWIKEGNAEYSSHLFFEHAYDKAKFKDVVIDNHYRVMQDAHIDDDGYHPLSGIPYEHTYGTTTYNKGACMMHNLRGYLGDTLFSQGMTSVLNTYPFSAIDAQQMQEQLTAETGVDMSHFFNNWIYQPGFASYEIDTINYVQNGNEWTATIYLQQKLNNAFSMHTETPLEITFFDDNWETHHTQFMVSGEFTEVTVSVPFEPVFQLLNDRNHLNLARFQDRKIVTSTGNVSLKKVAVANTVVDELPDGDSALISMVHQWVAPDADPTLPDLQLSSTHYWTFGGDFPDGFAMRTRFIYSGSNEDDIDYDLLSDTDTNLILVWRPNIETPWGEYPFYERQALGSSLTGFMKASLVLPGQYALANGEVPLATSVADLAKEVVMKVYPNPTTNFLNVQAILPTTDQIQLTVFDAYGKNVLSRTTNTPNGELIENLAVSQLPVGMYWLEIRNEDGTLQSTKKFVKN